MYRFVLGIRSSLLPLIISNANDTICRSFVSLTLKLNDDKQLVPVRIKMAQNSEKFKVLKFQSNHKCQPNIVLLLYHVNYKGTKKNIDTCYNCYIVVRENIYNKVFLLIVKWNMKNLQYINVNFR
jgi:hypothetical protein